MIRAAIWRSPALRVGSVNVIMKALQYGPADQFTAYTRVVAQLQCEIRAASSVWLEKLLVLERSIWTILSQRFEQSQVSERPSLCVKPEHRVQRRTLSKITRQSRYWG